MQFKPNAFCFSVLASVECWTCKWYFALSLLACMSECSFTMWIFIIVTIYSYCSCMVKLCFIIIFIFAWSYCSCSICILSFLPTMNLISAFCDIVFRRLVYMVQELHRSRIWCKWVLATIPNSHFLSLESVLGFSHGIAKEGDCKVEFIQLCVGFILCQICL